MKDHISTTRPCPTLFMWAGGKTKMFKYYEPLFPADIYHRPYVEPFAGGAAIFNQLSAHAPLQGILSDVKKDLMDVYRLVRDDPDRILEDNRDIEAQWMSLPTDERKSFYYDLRKAYWSMPEGVAATSRLYFLMKTGFNGIWQTCRDSKGRFGTPVGLAGQKTRVIDPTTIHAWSEKLSGTTILDGSYSELRIPAGSFVFCDPPYRDSFTAYGGTFGDDAQIALVEWCRRTHHETGSVVWLSNRDGGDGFFEHHAPDAELMRFPITYTAGRRKQTRDGFKAKSATELLLIWQ